MGFDTIPEDREATYPCDCGGEITETIEEKESIWQCNKCDFKKVIKIHNDR